MINVSYLVEIQNNIKKYVPEHGEGDCKESQIATALFMLIDGYVRYGVIFDNSYFLEGVFNLNSNYHNFANWLFKYTNEEVQDILWEITSCFDLEEYQALLINLADELLSGNKLKEMEHIPKIGSIYECDGPFKSIHLDDDDDDDDDESYWIDDDNDDDDYDKDDSGYEMMFVPTGEANEDGYFKCNLYVKFNVSISNSNLPRFIL